MFGKIRFVASLAPAACAVGSLAIVGGCYLLVQPPQKLSVPTKVMVGVVLVGSLASALAWTVVANVVGNKQ